MVLQRQLEAWKLKDAGKANLRVGLEKEAARPSRKERLRVNQMKLEPVGLELR